MAEYVNLKTGAVDKNVPTKETFKAELDKKLNLSGGTMSGDLTLPKDKKLTTDILVLGDDSATATKGTLYITISGTTDIDVNFNGNNQGTPVTLSGIKNIPNATSLDNNKFLRVVNGTPTWVALTNVAEEGA